MATAAAAAAAQQRVAAAAVDQTDTRAELLVQLDEQIAALDLKIQTAAERRHGEDAVGPPA